MRGLFIVGGVIFVLKSLACATFFFSFGGGHDGSLNQLQREQQEKKKMIPRDRPVKPIPAHL